MTQVISIPDLVSFDKFSLLISQFTGNQDLQLVEFGEKLIDLQNHYQKLQSTAPSFDFGKVHANGVRSFLLIIEHFLSLTYRTLLDTNTNKVLTKYKKQLNILINILDLLMTISAIQIKIVEREPIEELDAIRTLLEVKTEQWESGLGIVGTFWLTDDVRRGIAPFTAVKAAGSHRLRSLMSQSGRSKLKAFFALEANVQHYKDSIDYANCCCNSFISAVRFPCNFVKTFRVNVRSRYRIDSDGSVKSDPNFESEIELLVIATGRSQEFANSIVYHVHGGGFCCLSPKAYQSYLRKIARSMPGALVISINYRKSPAHPFPAALQDVLDGYLSIIGSYESNIEQQLFGYNRRKNWKILITGDSAGGHLPLALCRAINKINTALITTYDTKLPMPNNLVLCHTAGRLGASIDRPSKALMLLDPILTPAGLLEFMNAYSPGAELFDYEKDPTCWFRRSNIDQIQKRIREITVKSNYDELFDPTRDEFDIFTRTRLVLFASEFDPLLDDSVELARNWPEGQCELIIGRGCVHGCLMNEDSPSKEFARASIEKMKQMMATKRFYDPQFAQ